MVRAIDKLTNLLHSPRTLLQALPRPGESKSADNWRNEGRRSVVSSVLSLKIHHHDALRRAQRSGIRFVEPKPKMRWVVGGH